MKELTGEQINTAICKWMKESEGVFSKNYTDGPHSLGNMHQAESKLSDTQLVGYKRELRDQCWRDGEDGDDLLNLIRATARQRAVALLRVVIPELFAK